MNKRIWAILTLVTVTIFSLNLSVLAAPSSLSFTSNNFLSGESANYIIEFNTSQAIVSPNNVVIEFNPGEIFDAADDFNLTGFDFDDVQIFVGGNLQTDGAASSPTAWTVEFDNTGDIVDPEYRVSLFPPTVGTAATAGQPIVVVINGVANPTNPTNTIRVTTTSDGISSDVTANFIDGDSSDGNSQVLVSASVSSELTLTLGNNVVGFGPLSSASENYANTALTGSTTPVVAHTVQVFTNNPTGYSLELEGTTLTSATNPGDTITAIGDTASLPVVGSEQFGVNFNESVLGIGDLEVAFSTIGQYAFDPAGPNLIATASVAGAASTFEATYLANISSTTEPGSYNAVLTYTAFSGF